MVIYFVITFALIGSLFIIFVNASTPTSQFEAESGSLTNGASIVADSSASGGSALKFANSSTSYPAALWHANADADSYCGDDTQFYHRETDSAPIDRLQIVNDPLGQYGKVYKANLTPSDISAGNKRAEWRGSYTECNNRQKYAESLPQELHYGWRSLFGKDVALDNNENDGNYMQLKGDSSCGGPAVGLTISNNRLSLRTIDGDHLAWTGPAMTNLIDNRWHDFVLRVNFAKDSTGWLEIWLDGTKQTMANGQQRINVPTVCPNDTHVFWKLGVYSMDRGIGVGPEHWTESPRIGTTYESVVPR